MTRERVPSPTPSDFAHFRERILGDDALQAPLRTLEDVHVFVETVARLGEELGYTFTPDDVRAAIAEGRRSWREWNRV